MQVDYLVHKGVGTYHLLRKTEKSSWKIKWFRAILYGKLQKIRVVVCEVMQFFYYFWSVKLILIYCVACCSPTTTNFMDFTIMYKIST